MYLLPAAVGCAGLAALGVRLISSGGVTSFKEHFFRSLFLGLPLLYPVAILLLLKLNIIPQPIDQHSFGPALIPWRQGIDYVVGRPTDLWRDVVILCVIPLLLLRGNRGRFLFFYSCAIAALCLNPLLAPFWMKNITAVCYFRLVYLLPIPLLFLFLPLLLERRPRDGNAGRFWSLAAAMTVVLACAYGYKGLSIAPKNPILAWKSPLAYQILPANLKFAKAAGSYIGESKLLAPAWTASCELPLLFPRMK